VHRTILHQYIGAANIKQKFGKYNQLIFFAILVQDATFHQYTSALNHEKYLSTDMLRNGKTVQILNTQNKLPSGTYMHFLYLLTES
jgi:hypothetical protein